ncbi:aminotransferase class V-fold PLP-dependent enzyme [Pareuzebyella sediminis]|uniref:aminotransferase class V-fold PLP-dependent enzyme n=1 Tax=Pareuzebyella sediminis TaxID=2607998 RepID=UPI0011F05521|nr:aminotransferase class V-fold PLP-dependent enzyme [Pareuzebyella sediminis]
MEKRQFLKRMGQASLAFPLLSFGLDKNYVAPSSAYPVGDDEEFWKRIRQDYLLKPDYINLENGYYNFIPQPVLHKYQRHIETINYEASHYMRTVQWDNKARVAHRLAALVNAEPDTTVITRNATESLDLVICGFTWKKGDEALFAEQDYGAMRQQFEMVSKRYGTKNKIVSIPNHPESDEEIVAIYESNITDKTKLIMVSQMINITGQILPVRKICDMAHAHGVDVLVDGAHCVGHIDCDIKEMDCDYYGSSLHKWLSAPLGAGLLVVKKDKISKIWPLLADYEREPNDIGRLNHIGTHPVATDLAIGDAIDYLDIMGLDRKENRMRYLQRYWSDQLRDVPNIVVNTPSDEQRSCGIANIGISTMKPKQVEKTLLEEYGIYTVGVDYANVQGCRITPNVYTTTKELDVFIAAMKKLAS